MFFDRDEIKELNDSIRQAAEGSFVQLFRGVTHYELGGNPNGDVVVLVHGFSVPYFIYDPTFKFLTESGFRVLRYDLFGRGLSDRPHAPYNIELFVTQLTDLLDALRFIQPINLIGLSLGGSITSTFTVRHPERVKKLVMIDPAGARPIHLAPMLQAAKKIPFVAEAVLGWIGTDRLLQIAAKDLFDPTWVEYFKAKYKVQMQYKGFKHALLSTLRDGMLDSFIDVYRTLGQLNKPVLLFWGREDMTVPFEHSDDLRAVLPQVEFYAIEQSGHIPHYEKSDEVNPILLEFLRNHDPKHD
jgi:pimeloyl-ACP methyl ester carboxylesterase